MEKIPAHMIPEDQDPEKLTVFKFPDPKKAELKYRKLEKFLSNPAAAIYKKIERIHRFIDWVTEIKGIKSASVCAQGCAHCCQVDVDVGFLEALYIAHKAGLIVVERRERIHKGYHKVKNYCPFLNQETAQCSIYDYRPIACRSFFTFDSRKFCADESYPSHAVTRDVDDNVIFHILKELYFMGSGKSADIREWFKEYTIDPYEIEYAKNVNIKIGPN